MPHAAQLIHKMQMTALRPTTQVLRLAATRMSRRRKSSVLRMSAGVVADGQLAPLNLGYFPLITPHLRCLFRIWVSFVCNMDCRFRLSRSNVVRFMALAAPIRYTLMGLPLRFSFPEHMYFLLALVCANPVVSLHCPELVYVQHHAPYHTVEETRLW